MWTHYWVCSTISSIITSCSFNIFCYTFKHCVFVFDSMVIFCLINRIPPFINYHNCFISNLFCWHRSIRCVSPVGMQEWIEHRVYFSVSRFLCLVVVRIHHLVLRKCCFCQWVRLVVLVQQVQVGVVKQFASRHVVLFKRGRRQQDLVTYITLYSAILH